MQRKVKIENIIVYLLLIDMIFGGAGYLVTIAGISIRSFLFIVAMVYYFFVTLIRGRAVVSSRFLLLLFMFFVFIINALIYSTEVDFLTELDYISGYIPIFLCLFWGVVFEKESYDKIYKVYHFINNAAVIFALFDLAIWLYCLLMGPTSYIVILDKFLVPYNYGNLALLSGNIPRLVLKGSIFFIIGFLGNLDNFLKYVDFKTFFKLIILFCAILSTFTVGYYVITILGALAIFMINGRMTKKILVIIPVVLVAAIIAVNQFDVLDIMQKRFDDSYSVTYKLRQSIYLFIEFLKHPLIGNGFGHKLSISYSGQVRTTANFEVIWPQLLMQVGLLGFIPYIIHIYGTIKKLLAYKVKNDIFVVCAIGILVLCIESFFNPYMNNAIGLSYYAICVGWLEANIKSKSKI